LLDGSGTGAWTVAGGVGGTLVAPLNVASINVINLNVGQTLFNWTVTSNINTGCITTAQASVWYDPPTTANAGADQTVCSNAVNLVATNALDVARGETGLWALASGPSGLVFSASTSPSTAVTNLQDNVDYSFTWTVQRGVCTSQDLMKVQSLKVSSNAGVDQTVCSSDAQFAANPILSGQVGSWSYTSATGVVPTIDNSQSIISLVHNLNAGANPFKWTVSQSVCTTTSSVIIYNNSITTYAGDDNLTACLSNGTITLNGTAPLAGISGLWTVSQVPLTASSTPVIVTPSQYNTQVTGLQYGQYKFTWTVTKQDAKACSASSTVTIFNNYLQAVVDLANTTTTVCNSSASLQAVNPLNGTTGRWSVIDVFESLPVVANSSLNITTAALNSVNSKFQWTITSNSVPTCSSPVVVSVTNNQFYVSNAVDQTVCAPTATLSAIVKDKNGNSINTAASGNSWLWVNKSCTVECNIKWLL
jgi:hypothetical protein